ncbi:hypothetical protein LCGC14_0794200 [marine sediment metagenome]|uniref:Uncharacterized protein n=1 Tax=marine sediment metagenome TaxID=412755 RepID=A0A0F9SYS7_9ZZZZ
MTNFNNDNGFAKAQRDYDNQLPDDSGNGSECDGKCIKCCFEDCDNREELYAED